MNQPFHFIYATCISVSVVFDGTNTYPLLLCAFSVILIDCLDRMTSKQLRRTIRIPFKKCMTQNDVNSVIKYFVQMRYKVKDTTYVLEKRKPISIE